MATLKALMTSFSKQGVQEQRGEIIYNFTNGRTCSAKELTAVEINELYYELNKRASAKSQELDKKRKRLPWLGVHVCKVVARALLCDIFPFRYGEALL